MDYYIIIFNLLIYNKCNFIYIYKKICVILIMDSTIGIRYNILFPYQDKLMYNDLKIDS